MLRKQIPIIPVIYGETNNRTDWDAFKSAKQDEFQSGIGAGDWPEQRRGGPAGATEYWSDASGGWDIEKSKQLEDLKKEYGPAVENRILQLWQKINGQGRLGTVAPMYTGQNNMALAQDYFLTHEAPMLGGIRGAYQKMKKNPMLF